VRNRSSVDPDL